MNKINVPYKLRIVESNKEVLKELLEIFADKNLKKVALITSKTPNELITNFLEVELFSKVEKLKTFQVLDTSVEFAEKLPMGNFDVVIGIGGGKAIDTAKYVAHINKIPCISIPTIISNDGICSPISVLKQNDKYASLGASMPLAMIVPSHLIKKAGSEYLISGIGDVLSNLSAVEDWKLASIEKNEKIDDYAVIISQTSAKELLLLAQKYILLGKSVEEFLNDNLKTIINSISLSGIAMEISGTSRPASGAEHLISHAIDELYGGKKQHGLQVAFGTYIVSFIRYKNNYISKSDFEELRAVLRYLGLPITFNMIGISREELIKAIQFAPETRVNRFTILNKISLDKKDLEELFDGLFDIENKITN